MSRDFQQMTNSIGRLDVRPPHFEQYIKEDDFIYVSPLHGRDEKETNITLAKALAREIKQNIYLLPCIDPSAKNSDRLRAQLLPPGVKENKNPDYYIAGKFFDAKSMLDCSSYLTIQQQKQGIANRLKKGKLQADNIILEIPEFIGEKTLEDAVNDFLRRSTKERIIIIKHGRHFHVYGNAL